MIARASLLVVVATLGFGCSRNESASSGAGSSSAATSASATAPLASASVAAAPVDAAPADASFEGTYTATVGPLTLPADAPSWRGDDAGTGLGPGTLSFRIDGATGRLSGKGDGALGPVIVNGQLGEGGALSFTLLRADPTDGGFTGTGYGTRTGNTIQGTLHASTARGNVLREATFTVSAK